VRIEERGGSVTGLTHIDHIGIACHDLDAAVEFYRHTYGFELCHTEVNEEQGVREAMLRVGDAEAADASYIQLLEPIRDGVPVATFLATRGEGVHHIAFRTDDVATATADVAATGVRPLYAEPRHGTAGSLINFLHPRDCGGVLTELVEPSARSREDAHDDAEGDSEKATKHTILPINFQ
jgi:methylmalonyl-CoA/ethylmalonyl-CoA epimerase